MRRALYVLDHIFQKRTPSAVALPQVMEAAMRENPENWKSYYSANEISKWHFNYENRIRYYWSLPAVKEAVDDLILTFHKLKISKHILEQNSHSNVLERSEDLAASLGRTIGRSEVKSSVPLLCREP